MPQMQVKCVSVLVYCLPFTSMMKFALLLSALCAAVHGHGRLLEPPSRSSAWRLGFNTPPNYDDNQLFCGGASVSIIHNRLHFRYAVHV